MVNLCRAGILAVALFLPSMAPAGTIVTRAFASATLGREWSYTVYLPTGYDTSNLRYPVLYLLHGNGGTQNSWAANGRIQATIEPLIASGDVPPAIVVMPDAGTSWYVDRKEKMETAFLEDLIPGLQHYFRTLEERQGRSIAGMSMGGRRIAIRPAIPRDVRLGCTVLPSNLRSGTSGTIDSATSGCIRIPGVRSRCVEVIELSSAVANLFGKAPIRSHIHQLR